MSIRSRAVELRHIHIAFLDRVRVPQSFLGFDVRVVEGVPVDVALLDRLSGFDVVVHRVGGHPHAPQEPAPPASTRTRH
ncbi:hypothetical protein [Rhodococcus tibetensis]|uniref:Uncharacterized protein n=1 Tax=Rhodococcus tibetensis TaxID=2965064 RepID=A0ABT1QBM3_9NOCA|nr:hypothetical protein [Rhodococcus sp. FXJ9.536]MCQ4119597.1 hypothetical protein [Rhodococcus sp. FXJ9.536]